MDSDREMIEFEDKKMKEKKKFQGPVFQIREYSFLEPHEFGSNERYESKNNLYTREYFS